MESIRYPAILKRDGTGFVVQFVDLDEAFTEGDSAEEALFNASEVLTLTLDGRLAEGMALPKPSLKIKGAHYIAPDAKTQAALLVRQTRGEKSMAELARALNTSWPAAKRLEDPRHYPTIKQLEKAAAAMGKRLVLSFE